MVHLHSCYLGTYDRVVTGMRWHRTHNLDANLNCVIAYSWPVGNGEGGCPTGGAHKLSLHHLPSLRPGPASESMGPMRLVEHSSCWKRGRRWREMPRCGNRGFGRTSS